MASGSQPIPQDHAPSTNPSSPANMQWDGDKMFNIYILDYCLKRGYDKTAHMLREEAKLPEEEKPPIDAKQGLLFEWWSVFWVLFTAKSSGTGPEDAILYTQHQVQTQAQRQQQQQQQRPFGIMQPAQEQKPRIQGAMPGMPPGVQRPMMNGVGPQPGPPQGPAPNMNGPTQQQLAAGQRPGMPQQRPPNGVPYPSPAVPNSPHHPPNPQGTPQQPIGSGQPLTSMNPRMHPPNGPAANAGAQQTPQPAFQPLNSTSSQPGSPAQPGNMTARSPSMASRQPIGPTPDINMINHEISQIDKNQLPMLKQQLGLGDKDVLSLNPTEKRKLVDLARQRRPMVPQPGGPTGPHNPAAGPSRGQMMMPQRMGVPMNPNMQPPPPQQQMNAGIKRSPPAGDELNRTDSSPPKRLRTSPSGNEHPAPQGQPQQGPGPQSSQPHPPQPQQHQQPQQPQPPMMSMHPPTMANMSGHPSQMNPQMNRPPMGGSAPPMSSFPGPPGNVPNMGNHGGMMPMGMPNMAHMSPMNTHPSGPPGPGPQGQQYGLQQYRNQMHTLHKNNIAGQHMVGNSPQNPDPQFQDRPQSRSGAGMPGGMPLQFAGPQGAPNNRPMPGQQPGKMLPPPSPSVMNKKPDGGPGESPAGITASSPRNIPMPGSQASTPGMPGPGNPQSLGQAGQPQPNMSQNNALSGPSPTSILGGTPTLQSSSSMPPTQSQPPMEDFSDLFNGNLNMDFAATDGSLFSDLNSFDWVYPSNDGSLSGM
ncbi:hypothetical protein QCA50_011101 [Cerrena zonata]|uniref:LisH domain-containing protein n=1 Tax=Cerrena zonata TaxID=2478898 RepID=A0AAW0FX24_9APHY